MVRKLKKEYRKRLELKSLWLHVFEPELIPYDGSIITVTAHYGPFRGIRLENGQEFFGVGKGCLTSIKETE